MPRPKKSRPRAQASTAVKPTQVENEPAPRGRSRTTRSMASRTSLDMDSALIPANATRESALERLANEDVTTTGDDDDTAEPTELGRRSTATPTRRRDTTGLDLADDVFGDLEDSFEDSEAPVRGRSTEISSFSFSHVKPRSRSRQSSIIGRNDPPIRPSSRGGTTPLVSSTFNISQFRRRAREPSILGTGRKQRPDVTSTTFTTQGPASDSEDEEGFAPEAESTPLNNRRRTQQAAPQPEEPESILEPAATRSSRKRRSDGVPEGSSRPEKAARPSQADSDLDNDSDLSSLSSPPSIEEPLPRMDRPVTPINQSDHGAPPASSGSEGEEFAWPDIHGLAKRRRRPSVTDPLDQDNMSNVSSPPSLTHSPNFEIKAAKARGRSRTRRHSSPKLTTAELTGLLPRRRHKRAKSPTEDSSDEEIDTTGIGQDEDELSYVNAPRRRGGSRAGTRRQPSRSGQAKTKAPEPQKKGSRPTLTYSQRSSDKENQSDEEEGENEEGESQFQPLPDDTFDGHDHEVRRPTEELTKAAAKFKEVDRWELEFETATDLSSPAGAGAR